MADTKDILAQNEALAKLVATRERDLEIQKKLNKVAKNRKSDLQEEVDFYKKQTKFYRETNVQLTSYIENAQAAATAGLNEQQLLDVVRAKAAERLEELKEKTEDLTKAEEEEIVQIELMTAAFEEGVTSVKDLQKHLGELGDDSSGLYKAKDAAENLGTALDEAAQSVLGISSNWNQAGLSGAMLDAFHKSSDLSDIFADVGNKISESINPTNMLGTAITSMVTKTKELTMELGSAFGKFKEATGGGEEYLGVLSNTTAEMRGLNISTEEAASSVEELYKELAMFSTMSEQAQKELSKTVATLRAFDVQAGQAVAAADILMQSVGYTKDEFIAFEQSLKSMSNAINVPMSTLHEQFVAGADIIGKYGKKGEAEFKKLAAAAKATGIGMQSLLDIAEQFDTFESAAEQVGSLNAMLGGAYFDTVQMVNATEEERIDLLRRGVQATGKSFDQLGRYEKKAIAAAAGISDINEANKLFGTSTGAYAELQALASDASMSLSDLSEEAFNTLGPMEKFEAVMKKLQKPMDLMLKILDGIASALYFVVDGMETLWKKTVGMGEAGGGFTITITAMMAVLFKFGGVLKFVFGLFGSGAKLAGPASKSIAAAIKTIGTAATVSAKGLLAMGAATALVGVGIYAILSGVAELASSFKDLDGWQIAGALGAIALSMTLIIIGLKILIPVLAAAGATAGLAAGPLLAVGAAITLIGFGIKMAVDSMAGAITAMASLFTSFGSLTLDGAAAMAAFATEIGKFSKVEIEQELTTFTKHLGTLIMESAKVTPESAAAVKTIFQETATLAAVEVNDNAELLEAIANLVAASNRAAPAAQAAGGTGGGQMEVTVNIDGQRAWKGIRPYYVKEFK